MTQLTSSEQAAQVEARINYQAKRASITLEEIRAFNSGFIAALDHSAAEREALREALEMVIEAAAVYGYQEVELTPGQLEIRRLAKEAKMTPNAYVMKVVRAAVGVTK